MGIPDKLIIDDLFISYRVPDPMGFSSTADNRNDLDHLLRLHAYSIFLDHEEKYYHVFQIISISYRRHSINHFSGIISHT